MPSIHKKISDLSVLIVDDTTLVLTLLSGILKDVGFINITTANSFETALNEINNQSKFDVIFLDRYLGDDSGIEILRSLRSKDNLTPVIMLTQEDDSSKVIESIACGASDYIVKPFNHEIVVKKLESILGIKFSD